MKRAFAGLLVMLVACVAERPELRRWDACWHEGAALVFDEGEGTGRIEPGPEAVLRLNTAWGIQPGAVDSGFYAHLLVELPVSAAQDEALSLADWPGRYVEGIIFGPEFESDSLAGEARFVSLNDRSITWDLDGEAVEPSVDLDQVGSMPFQGRVRAVRGDVDGCD